MGKISKIKELFNFLMLVFIFSAGALSIFYFMETYPKVFANETKVDKINDVNPRESIILNFSQPVIKKTIVDGMKIVPRVEATYSWEGDRRLKITPKEAWAMGKRYDMEINKGKNIMLMGIDEKMSFNVIDYPRVALFSPSAGEKDVLVDMEDPIEVLFDKKLGGFNLKFEISPFNELVYQLDPDERSVELLFKDEYKRGQRYEIKIFAKYKGEANDRYEEVYVTFFETLPLAPEEWSKDFSQRLIQARKFTQPKITEGKYIDINLKNQVLSIFEDGKVSDVFLISSGKPGMNTPTGEFKIHNKYPRPWSKKYSLYMPHWMAFVPSGSYGIHELPEWPGGYKEGANHLGIPVSHGCVRLGIGSAEKVYNWAEIGTPVIVY